MRAGEQALRADDPVMRVVDRAMEAQMRLMIGYMENMREQIRREVEREVRAEFGGDRPYFGKGTSDRNKQRDEAIRRDARPASEGGLGLSQRALGRKYHTSQSNVCKVLAANENIIDANVGR